jgi:ketosteroid isomerase-like protein
VDEELRRLVDRQQIVDVTLAYTYALDAKDWDALDDVFTVDATAFLTEELEGREAIKGRVRRALESLDLSQHMVANHDVRIDGDSAVCRCYLQAQHVREAAPGPPNFIVAGRYDDRFVRTSVGWRIARRELTIMWTEGNPSVTRPRD